MADCFKDRQKFRVLEWNQGVTSPGGVYAENNINPDFHIKQTFSKGFNIEYYVEAKYLSHWKSANTIELKDYQIDRYHRHQSITRRKVILAIGIGGKPQQPAEFYLLPLDSICEANIPKSALSKFAISQNEVEPYMTNYFRDHVFKKSSHKNKNE